MLELVRVVSDGSGRIVIAPSSAGRGAWLCAGSAHCLDLAERRDAFSRSLRTPVSPEAVRALRNTMKLGESMNMTGGREPVGALGPAGSKRARMGGHRSATRKD
ncbi:MAG: YlxR family protein [Actinomycetota bacterium]|nr:YlxR family protein [Actinomycetota bacterium]